ncbi:histidine kinase [uncultured Massilia sp.]|uniref:sensor histidine kinase n=1 Tax=uncultured Massilia sp. TaxID=169973 RepID=UPI0025E00111|nr:histidine kinase [uncultured Massilia sp.]
MFCASSVGMAAFGIAMHVIEAARTRDALESPAFVTHARASFVAAAPLLRAAARDPAACAYGLRLLLADLLPPGTLPSDGANALARLLADGRAAVTYVDAGGAACTYPRGVPAVDVAPTPGGAVRTDTGRKRGYRAALDAGGARLALRLRLHGPVGAMAHSPSATWTVGFSFIVVLNLLCALTLVPLLVRRIRRAQRAARAWTHGDTRTRIVDATPDEFGDLARSFNRLADSFEEVIRVKQDLAAAEERNRLARELHDTAKQRAFALSLQLTALKSAAATAPGQREHLVATSVRLVRQLQSDLAGVIQRLSGATLAERGVRAVLAEEVPALLGGAGIGWTLDIPDAVDAALRGAPHVTQQVLLIAIEAVANAREHAHARALAVTLSASGAGYLLAVRDDGQGFDPRAGAGVGMGLVNMRARAHALPGGAFHVDSGPGAGTRVSVAFHLEPEKVPA